METEKHWVAATGESGNRIRIVKKATALEPTSHEQLFPEPTANSEAQ